jgi:5-methylcytosine-specific restriction endonuclease McrA
MRELRRKRISAEFYDSREWLALRFRVLAKHGAICMLCKTGGSTTNPIQVDHIKPRSKYPALALVESNLQVLCKACNHGKSNTDQTDFRFKASAELAANIKNMLSKQET